VFAAATAAKYMEYGRFGASGRNAAKNLVSYLDV
jgi:hypothetical protein